MTSFRTSKELVDMIRPWALLLDVEVQVSPWSQSIYVRKRGGRLVEFIPPPCSLAELKEKILKMSSK